MTTSSRSGRLCFVTIGATASFDALIEACLQPAFLAELERAGYTELLLQYGKEGKRFIDEHQPEVKNSKITVQGFDFDQNGLNQHMRAAKGTNDSNEGVVISHAGSGSILDALRINAPIIVVPNPSLLDDHQTELAEALARQGYVVHGKLNDLPAALKEAEELRSRPEWPPVNSGQHRQARGLAGVMDEEMGFLD